jgi:hypothetical protein
MAIYRPRCRVSLRLVLDQFGGPQLDAVWIEGIVPTSVTVYSNPAKDPDEFDVELDLDRAPFDARQIRAAAVSVYLWNSDGSPGDEDRLTPDRLQIVGLCDEPDTSRTDGTSGTLRLIGKDYTMALARPWPVGKLVPVGRPVDAIVQQLVDECTRYAPPSGGLFSVAAAQAALGAMGVAMSNQRLTVVWKGKAPGPVGHGVASKPSTPPVMPGAGTKAAGWPVEDDATYWQVIRWICAQVGLTVQVRDLELWIQGEHEIATDAVRSMALGKNLRSLTMGRRLGVLQVPQIIVKGGLDPKTRQPVEGRYPRVAQTGQEPEVMPFYGVIDPVQLDAIAKRYYVHRARSEGKITAVTTHMADLNGDAIWGMRAGDPLHMDVEPPHERAMEKMTAAQRQRYMVGLGYHPAAASAIAANYDRLRNAPHAYLLKGITKTWHTRSGPNFDMELNDYVFVERDGAAA